jgi:hypothetical protein
VHDCGFLTLTDKELIWLTRIVKPADTSKTTVKWAVCRRYPTYQNRHHTEVCGEFPAFPPVEVAAGIHRACCQKTTWQTKGGEMKLTPLRDKIIVKPEKQNPEYFVRPDRRG